MSIIGALVEGSPYNQLRLARADYMGNKEDRELLGKLGAAWIRYTYRSWQFSDVRDRAAGEMLGLGSSDATGIIQVAGITPAHNHLIFNPEKMPDISPISAFSSWPQIFKMRFEGGLTIEDNKNNQHSLSEVSFNSLVLGPATRTLAIMALLARTRSPHRWSIYSEIDRFRINDATALVDSLVVDGNEVPHPLDPDGQRLLLRTIDNRIVGGSKGPAREGLPILRDNIYRSEVA